ncbi:MAG: hypothetical protein FJW20_08200 [Acidimicrobiia bacterium]|nr:hypothetical protein [Acidimicrobiia bacterium]
MDAMIFMFLPLFTAAGSALLAFYIMQARMEVALSKEREALIEAKSLITHNEKQLESKIQAVEAETKRKSMDDFLADFRVEERHYMRENKSLFLNRKSMVLQERLYFRNLPLSNWVEHELTVEEGGDIQSLAKACSIFTAKGIGEKSLMGNGATRLLG